MHAITANKGVVVYGYRELTSLAESKGRRFLFESTVLGGSPVFSVFRECMPGAELMAFRGVLNATTNIILTHMESGSTFEQAVKYCQSIGVAETDPSADVDGWDAAIKVAALVTVLMGVPMTPQQVERQGIRAVTPEMIAKVKADGRRCKLVCSAERTGKTVHAAVAPKLVPASDPLYGMEDSTTGVTFRTDVLGDYSIIESERERMVAGPVPTAYGLFADFINAKRIVRHRLIAKVVRDNAYQIPCYAGNLGGALFANGDVYPCELLIDRKLGNVRDAGYDFRKIWFGPEADKARRFIRESKCFCTYECFLTINILFNPRMMPAVLKEWSSLKVRKAWRRLTGQKPVRATLGTCGTSPQATASAAN